MITTFVMVMMLIIEFINIRSKGLWSSKLKRSKFSQFLLSAFLGITPGCLGAYTVVSLYTHNIVSFGALVTVLIATSGDEAFVMFSMFPAVALKLTAILFAIAIAAGYIVDFFLKKKKKIITGSLTFPIHVEKIEHQSISFNELIQSYKNISFQRAILLFGLILFGFGLLLGDFGHNHFSKDSKSELYLPHEIDDLHDNEHLGNDTIVHIAEIQLNDSDSLEHKTHNHDSESHSPWNWITITFLLLTIIALAIVATSSDHFLDSHLWEHIIKKHFLKIFLWTFGALFFINILVDFLHLEDWLQTNQIMILIIAVLIGLIPESGPHLIFVTLFFEGAIPFSTLLASSIVQDGHGALPLFAESKRSFVYAKLINLVIGLFVGFLGLYFHF